MSTMSILQNRKEKQLRRWRRQRSWVFVLGVLLCCLFLPEKVWAIPPPDFVVNAGMQLVHVIGFLAFAVSSGLGVLLFRMRTTFSKANTKGHNRKVDSPSSESASQVSSAQRVGEQSKNQQE